MPHDSPQQMESPKLLPAGYFPPNYYLIDEPTEKCKKNPTGASQILLIIARLEPVHRLR